MTSTLPSSTTVRLRHLATKVHELGVRPTFELLAEFIAGSSDPAWHLSRVEAYGAIDGDVLRALGGDSVPPTIWRVK
jgi:hypothetical protein